MDSISSRTARSPTGGRRAVARIAEFRFRYNDGRLILTHRALRYLDLRRRDVTAALVLGAAVTVGWLVALQFVGELWARLFAWGQAVTGLGGEVWLVRYRIGGILNLAVPVPIIQARLPTRADFVLSALGVLVLVIASYIIPQRRLPLRYLLRVTAAVHASAVVTYAFIVPPLYSSSAYLGAVVAAAMMILAMLPLMLTATCYFYDMSMARKVGVTVLLMGHLTVFVPLQYLGHAIVLQSMSLLFMPVLYILGGLLLNVMIVVAFYGWAMGGAPAEPQPRRMGRWRRARPAGALLALLIAAGAGCADPVPPRDPAVPAESVVVPPTPATNAPTVGRYGDVAIREIRLATWREWVALHGLRPAHTPLWLRLAWYGMLAIVTIICTFAARHYVFTIQRLLGSQRHPYTDLETLDWPGVSVLVPAHNEENVIAQLVRSMLELDYPRDRLDIVVINHRSTDRTGEILRELEVAHPGRFRALHLGDETVGGKPAALHAAMDYARHDILLIFDADYTPGRGLVKQLAAPFADPEVGAVMGRVVPRNTGHNLLTRLLDLERAGGYQVDQQARMNLGLVPLFGGTVGGVRRRALHDAGGWNVASITEDTDLTMRLVVRGWSVVYQNRSECYEEVPEQWGPRLRQVRRWAIGHNHVARSLLRPLLASRFVSRRQKLDGALLLGVFIMGPLTMIGWLLALIVFYGGLAPYHGLLAILAIASYATLGNFAAFYENATAARLDRTYGRIRLLPLLIIGFLASLFTVSSAVLHVLKRGDRAIRWDKTPRGQAAAPPAG